MLEYSFMLECTYLSDDYRDIVRYSLPDVGSNPSPSPVTSLLFSYFLLHISAYSVYQPSTN